MKLLNEQAITAAYWRFLGHFLALMLTLVLIVFMFRKTAIHQIELLSTQEQQYDKALSEQRALAENVDSLYRNLDYLNTGDSLNTGLIRSPPGMEERIHVQKERLKKELVLNSTVQLAEGAPHAVYQKFSRYVDEIVVLKASLREVSTQIQDKRAELKNCQQRLAAKQRLVTK